MVKSRACAKCGSTRLIRLPGTSGSLGERHGIQVGPTIFSVIPVSRLVCSDCGFVEQWVESKAALARLADHAKRRRDKPS